jgi:hypothetical protein
MKNTILSLLCVAVLTAAGPAPVHDPFPSRATGKVVVLENENLMEGDIERIGDQYRIRRTIGETWLEGERVLYLCSTREEAFAFVRGRANLGDADERARLAHWCRVNNLRQQAIAELRAAVELRPDSAELRRMLNVLEHSVAAHASAPKPAPSVPAAPLPPPVDVTDDCLSMFATKVQPILMNVCASCHSAVYPGPFRLLRCDEPSLANRKTVQQNLAVVVAQINPARPEASPLLTRAVSAHGPETQAPLHGRQMAAFRTLEEWVRRTLENNPQLRGTVAEAPPATLPPTAAPPAPLPLGDSAWGTGTPANGSPRDRAAGTIDPAAYRQPSLGRGPTPALDAQPKAKDPYDPEEFNRLAHPDRPSNPGPTGR